MAPEIGQAGFRIGFFMVAVAGVLLFFLTPGTAEYVITQLTLIIGVAFLLLIVALVMLERRR